MSHPKSDSKKEINKEEDRVWPERAENQSRLPRVLIKWLVSLKLKNKFMHPRWDAASGVLIAEILSRYFPETGPGYILPVCYGHGWRHFEKNWFFLRQFFKSTKLNFPEELIVQLMTRKGNAGYFALLWLWETFETKTKLPKVEKGALTPTGPGIAGGEASPTCVNEQVIASMDFFHHDRQHQQTLPIGQRETHSTCFRQNITGNQMKWDDCHQTWAQWSNRLWDEQKTTIELLKNSHPKRMGIRKTGVLWKGIRRAEAEQEICPGSMAASRGTSQSAKTGAERNANQSFTSIFLHTNAHAGII